MDKEIYFKSDYLLAEKINGAKDVVLYFAPVGVPAGVYIGRGVLAAFDAHRIFVNCANDQWYLDGITGIGDFGKSVSALADIVQSLRGPGGKVVAFGGSMGGYGAILYGCAIGADAAIGQGTEFILGIPGGASEGALAGTEPNRIDIYSYINKSKTKVFNYFGEGSITDAFCAITAESKCVNGNFSNYSVRGLLHTLPNYLHTRYGVPEFVQSGLRNRMYCLDGANEGALLDHPDVIRASHKIYETGILNPAGVAGVVESVFRDFAEVRMPSEVKSFLFYHAALALVRAGQAEPAMVHAREAVAAAPTFLWNNAIAIRLSDSLGLFDEIAQYIGNFLSEQDHIVFLNDLDATYCCAKYLSQIKGDYLGAMELCSQIVKHMPSHDVTWTLIDVIIKEIQDRGRDRDNGFFAKMIEPKA